MTFLGGETSKVKKNFSKKKLAFFYFFLKLRWEKKHKRGKIIFTVSEKTNALGGC